jgi:hypothetical protein
MQKQVNLAWSNDPDFQQGWKDSIAGIRRIPASVKDLILYNQGYTAAKKHATIYKTDEDRELVSYEDFRNSI